MNNLPDKNKDVLHQLIDANLAEKPSPGFNVAIMQQLGVAPKASQVTYEPAISKNGWIFIAIITALIFYFALSGTGNNVETHPLAGQIGKSVDNGLSTLLSLFESSSMVLICMAVVSIFILTIAESLYRQ